MLARGAKDKERAMSQTRNAAIAVVGIDIGKNSFHIVGLDERGAIVLRQRGRVSQSPTPVFIVIGRQCFKSTPS